MTKSKAIEIMENYTEKFEGGASIYEALKMATESLKNEGCVIDKVLEIIAGCKFSDDSEIYPYDGIMWNNRALEQAKQEILRLKQGEQE